MSTYYGPRNFKEAFDFRRPTGRVETRSAREQLTTREANRLLGDAYESGELERCIEGAIEGMALLKPGLIYGKGQEGRVVFRIAGRPQFLEAIQCWVYTQQSGVADQIPRGVRVELISETPDKKPNLEAFRLNGQIANWTPTESPMKLSGCDNIRRMMYEARDRGSQNLLKLTQQ